MEVARKSAKEKLMESIGFTPKGEISSSNQLDETPIEAIGWLYAARGFYKMHDFHSVIEAVTPALRNEKTKREAQHLLAFSFMHTGQYEAAVGAFFKSIGYGNESDWQPLVELLMDHPDLKLT